LVTRFWSPLLTWTLTHTRYVLVSLSRCGAETRTQAKTIDLCNNPKTKEPKLASARRIIAEWPHLNDEANEFTRRALDWLEGSITADALADTSYMVELLPMVEGVSPSCSISMAAGLPSPRPAADVVGDGKNIAMDHDEL